MLTETNPTPKRGRRIVQIPTNHNGVSRCPAAVRPADETRTAEHRHKPACLDQFVRHFLLILDLSYSALFEASACRLYRRNGCRCCDIWRGLCHMWTSDNRGRLSRAAASLSNAMEPIAIESAAASSDVGVPAIEAWIMNGSPRRR